MKVIEAYEDSFGGIHKTRRAASAADFTFAIQKVWGHLSPFNIDRGDPVVIARFLDANKAARLGLLEAINAFEKSISHGD